MPSDPDRRIRRRRKLLGLLAFALASAVAASFALRCPPPDEGPPRSEWSASARGDLFAGAAKHSLELQASPSKTGNHLWTSLTPHRDEPSACRALAFAVNEHRVVLVSVETMTPPPGLAAHLRAKSGADDVWVVATHTHSSLAGYDPRLAAQIGGVGRYQPAVWAAIASSCQASVAAALGSLEPATLTRVDVDGRSLAYARSGDAVDGALFHLVVRGRSGDIGDLVIATAHPTIGIREPSLHGDYPQALARQLEAAGRRVAIVAQGVGGNASAAVESSDTPESYARSLLALLSAAENQQDLATADAQWNWSRWSMALPPLDASRIAPRWARSALTAVACLDSAPRVGVSRWAVAGLTMVALPFEVTESAARTLREADPGAVILSIANDYWGYVESSALVRTNAGESRHQYFREDLVDRLRATLARENQPAAATDSAEMR